MAAVTTRANQAAKLQEGLAGIFGLRYKMFEDFTRKFFTIENSEKAYEEWLMDAGLGLASIKTAEGQPFPYQVLQTAFKQRFDHVTFGLSAAVTWEQMKDNQYDDTVKRIGNHLGVSMAESYNVMAANVFNLGHLLKTGDGVPLFSESHPLKRTNKVNSNLLGGEAGKDLGVYSLQDARTLMQGWRNEAGLRINVKPDKLIIPTGLYFEALQILGNQMMPGTGDNDINTLYTDKTIMEMVEFPYLSDQDSWFLTTTCPDGLICYIREPTTMKAEGDFDTDNWRVKIIARRSWGCRDTKHVIKGS